MRERRLLASVLLLALIVAAPLAAFVLSGCADDDCPPSCGDCALCALAADFGAAPVDLATSSVGPVRSELAVTAVAAPPRAVEHVPLRRG